MFRSQRRVALIPALAFVALACASTEPQISFVAEGTTFSPTAIITSGGASTVTWRFGTGGPHTVTFEDAAPGSGDRTSGFFQRTFPPFAPGTYRFRCEHHSTNFVTGMVGSVIVP